MLEKPLLTIIIFLLAAGTILVGCKSLDGDTDTISPPTESPSSDKPNITIQAIVPGVSITIIAENFPPNTVLTARIGEANTKGVGGIIVGESTTDAYGAMIATYSIPPENVDNNLLAIRLEGGQGYWAYRTFDNQ